MTSQKPSGVRSFLGIARPKDYFARTLAALPPNTKLRETRADETDPVVSYGILLYAAGLIAALFAGAWGPAVIILAGLLLGAMHELAETGGPVWRFIRLVALPALAAGLVLWVSDATLVALALVLSPIAGYLCMAGVSAVNRSRRSTLDAAPLPRWLRRATGNGRAVAVLRKYPGESSGEGLLARDREAFVHQGYEQADEFRIGDADPSAAHPLLDAIWIFVSPGSGMLPNGPTPWIYALFVKSSVLHGHR